MKRTTWTLALLLTLASSSALLADNAYRDRDRSSNPDACPRTDQMGRVSSLARNVEAIADEMHQRTERNNRRPDRFVARVLGDLHDLSNAAAHFQDETVSYQRDPRHTRDDFRALLAAYQAVNESLRDIEPRSYIDRGMEQVGELLAQLDDYYGYGDRNSYGRRGRYGSSDRYGRYPSRRGWSSEREPVSFELQIDLGGRGRYGSPRSAQ